jgi:hypothetical protein
MIMGRRKFIQTWLTIMGQGTLLSYLDVCYCVWQFGMGRESAEDSRRTGRPPDFQADFRIDGALEASPNASVLDIAQTTGITTLMVFYALTQVLHLELRNRKRVPHKLNDN